MGFLRKFKVIFFPRVGDGGGISKLQGQDIISTSDAVTKSSIIIKPQYTGIKCKTDLSKLFEFMTKVGRGFLITINKVLLLQKRIQNPVIYLRLSIFRKQDNGFHPVAIFAKSLILDVKLSSEHASEYRHCT